MQTSTSEPRERRRADPNEDFAEPRTGCAALAIGRTRTVPPFAPGAAHPAGNSTVIIEFLADDVDGVHQNLAGFVEDLANEPATMRWGQPVAPVP